MGYSLRWLLLMALPLAAAAAPSAQREFERVVVLPPDAAHGQALFQECAACHGVDGGGQTNGSVPRIAGQHYRVLVRQIIDFRRGRRWDVRMEGVGTRHEVLPDPQSIADVAGYASRLQHDGARGIRDGQFLERGAATYGAQCSSCHGVDASGNERKDIPRLAGQHAGYLSRQIYDAVDGRRPVLAKSHGKLFEPLDFEQVMGLSDYLARLGWQP